MLNLQTPYARLTDLFDGPVYRLQKPGNKNREKVANSPKPSKKRTKSGIDPDAGKGTFIQPLPTDGSVQPLSELEIKAELLYNRIPFSKILL